MRSNEYGQVSRNDKEILELLYQFPDIDITKINFENLESVKRFNASAQLCNVDTQAHQADAVTQSIDHFDQSNQSNWFIPKSYIELDLEEYLLEICPKENYQRLRTELELFKKHNMVPVLQAMKYIVDTLRQNNIVWGVGRGSSVASYALFLLGIHKVDSVKYNLDIGEFLK